MDDLGQVHYLISVFKYWLNLSTSLHLYNKLNLSHHDFLPEALKKSSNLSLETNKKATFMKLPAMIQLLKIIRKIISGYCVYVGVRMVTRLEQKMG